MADRPKQKNVKIPDVALFEECKALLKTEFGDTLTNTQVVQSGLCWLKLGRTQKMIPFDEAAEQAKRGFLPHVSAALAETLNVLMDAGLLTPGDYVIEGNPETLQIRLLKDGEVITGKPTDETESIDPPEWVAAALAGAQKKQVAH